MLVYDWIFLALASVVGWRVRNEVRPLMWLFGLAMSYGVSAAYYRMGGSSPIVMAAACDAILSFVIYWKSQQRWELHLGKIVAGMLAVNIVFLALPDNAESLWRNALAGMLDLGNAASLAWLWINGAPQHVGAADGLGKSGKAPTLGSRVRRALLALHRERAHPPFWKVHH